MAHCTLRRSGRPHLSPQGVTTSVLVESDVAADAF